MQHMRLRDMGIGDEAKVVGYAPSHQSYRSKLLSMGLTKGVVIQVRNIAPLGDPVHISVRDFELSLRRDEADALLLEPVEGEGGRHLRRRRGRGLFGAWGAGRGAGGGKGRKRGTGRGRGSGPGRRGGRGGGSPQGRGGPSGFSGGTVENEETAQ